MFQLLVALGGDGQRFEFRDQIEHMARPLADVLRHALGRVEGQTLRQVTNHQIAAAGHFAVIRILQAGEDAQESRLAAAVAPDQPDAIGFFKGEGGPVEHGLLRVTHDQIRGAQKCGHRWRAVTVVRPSWFQSVLSSQHHAESEWRSRAFSQQLHTTMICWRLWHIGRLRQIKPTAPNPAIASRLDSGYDWRGVGEPGR